MPSQYYRKQHSLMLRGLRKPDGKGEMLDLLRHEKFSMSSTKAAQIKKEWEQEDKIVGRNLARVYKYRDEPPPCHDCPPEVFGFCYVTSKQCRGFEVWGNSGKRRATEQEREAKREAKKAMAV
jgi:hypothetical protein